jgi:predicted alpha/beta superfamily hydrolase
MKKSQNRKNHVFAQQNGFGPAFLHALMRVVKGIVKSNNTSRRVTAALFLIGHP